MKIDDFKYKKKKKIVQELYYEFEKEDSNVNTILDRFNEEETQNHLTAIMAEDYGITDNQKAIEDIFGCYPF